MRDDTRDERIRSLIECNAIAIVGLAGRFPGADDVATFWRNMREGRDTISHFTPDELEDHRDDATRASDSYVAARPIIESADKFDAGFFGMYPREAALTDPQQRLFLQCAWEALEDAGCDPATVAGAVGVFAGCSMSTYFLHNVCQDRATTEEFCDGFQVENYPMLVGASQEFLATRVAYRLDLKGPAITLGTACSTSLVAVQQACQNLQTFQCDMALAGGASISVPQKRGYLYQDGGMTSPDGVCRPFDAAARGTVFGGGAGVVALKRLEDAIEAGDRIYAVIRGGALNNDGAAKVGFTAPSVEGQASAIATAQAVAGVAADTIGYVETHGTGTPLGDPIEFQGLTKAFRVTTEKQGFCAVGSAKANLGHLDSAAGVVGLIRASLALHHAEIPPLAHFEAPNPAMDVASSPFYFPREAKAWTSETPRRAGVSAFGVGGTNAHLVLEEAPPAPRAAPSRTAHVLPVSARDEAALRRATARLAAHLEAHPDLPLADVAATLQSGRRAFPCRASVVAGSIEEARAALGEARATTAAERPPVVFLFPGQGAQQIGMGRALYRDEPIFRSVLDEGAARLKSEHGVDILAALFGEDADAQALTQTRLAQPAIYLVEVALARLWMAWGVTPAAMIGHSVGEFAAATLAGVMRFEDALDLVAARGALMQEMAPGAMLAARLPERELAAILPEELDLAALNGPALCVVAGAHEAIERFEATLAAREIGARRLVTSHAFHSRMMDPAIAALETRFAQMRFEAPQSRFVSTLTGDWADAEDVRAPSYWARHCRAPVRFAAALERAAEAYPDAIFLEVGPGRGLTTLTLQAAPGAGRVAVASMPDPDEDASRQMAEALASLWRGGVAPDWRAARGDEGRVTSLPTYPFAQDRCWIDPPPSARARAADQETAMTANPTAPRDETPKPACGDAPAPMKPTQSARLEAVFGILETLSGRAFDRAQGDSGFLELGFDSLFLGQAATQIQKRLGVKVTFRDILAKHPTPVALARHLDALLGPEKSAPAAPIPRAAAPTSAPVATNAPLAPVQPPAPALANRDDGVAALFREQLRAMQELTQRQIAALTGAAPVGIRESAGKSKPADLSRPADVTRPADKPDPVVAPPSAGPQPDRFVGLRPGAAPAHGALTQAQRDLIADLVARASRKTPGSRAHAQRYRAAFADPRVAAGFRQEWKQIVYPLLCVRSKGSRIVDVDGEEYVDLVNGFGQTMFGHAPEFVLAALDAQMREGFAIGPQTPLAGALAERIAAMTGTQRVTFCNTGSEAVMAAMRVARAVNGRDVVVTFEGDYHGQFDEVLVKPAGLAFPPRSLGVASGIPEGAVARMVVLPHGDPRALEWLRANIGDVAAVVLEPAQSRKPGLDLSEEIRALREITRAGDAALVFDEVVTGFRTHPGGMQHLLGVKADLVTYGKVIGGGMPIGVLAGDARYMDALDGGHWSFDDDSAPEVAPTFFAGTFVRHPLALAAVDAVLTHLEAAGPALQEALTHRMAGLASRLNAELERRGATTRIQTRSSWFHMDPAREHPLASLLFPLMRLHGVHVQEGFPCFLTTAHSDEDVARIESAFVAALDALNAAGVLCAPEFAAAQATTARAPVTDPQREIWLAAQASDDASCAFNEGVTLRLDGALDRAALNQAFAEVTARHDALNVVFDQDGEAMRRSADARPTLEQRDVAGDAEAALAEECARQATTPFDLHAGPLLRATLLALAPERHALVLCAHHIVCDGWSLNVILNELAEAYAARQDGRASRFAAPASFLRHALDQSGRTDLAETAAHWRRRFETPAVPLDLPTDRPRPARRTFAGATCRATIDAEATRRLRAAGAAHGATLFSTLFVGLRILLARLGDHDDAVVAVPTAGQALTGDGPLVGHCVNLLPVRAPLDMTQSCGEALRRVAATVLDDFAHQEFTLGALGVARKLAAGERAALTQIQFNLEKLGDDLAIGDLRAEARSNDKARVNFDLFLNIVEDAEGLRLELDHSTELWDRATMARWLELYVGVLDAMARDPSRGCASLDVLTAIERSAIAAREAAARDAAMAAAPAHALVARQAAATPEATAVICDGRSVDYRALVARAEDFAACVRARMGAEPGRVAVALRRSVDLPAALLGVMMAGHAYAPLDPTHPRERLAAILYDARPGLLICDDDDVAALAPPNCATLRPDALEGPRVAAPACEDLDRSAYVIYTSGSTGKPKGVEVGHRAFANLLRSFRRVPGCGAHDRVVAMTTVSFDIAGLELFLPLICGARLIVATRAETQGATGALALIDAHRATLTQATPSGYRLLLEAGLKRRPGLRLLVGGEAMPRDVADALLGVGDEVWNCYGPTETTIWSSLSRIAADAPISIGEPVANTTLHVVDRHGGEAAAGVAGELMIGGDGLAKGYFGRPDLTAAAFARRRGLEGAPLLYATGDLARRGADGAIVLLGRRDDQIKLRGFRIELGDVESAILRHESIEACAVVLSGPEDARRLVAHCVTRQGAGLDAAALAAHVAQALPDYMRPALWARVERLPMTPNGKLDRKALAAQAVQATPAAQPAAAPKLGATAARIAEIWRDVLKLDRVGEADDLFALGADSIQIWRIAARLNQAGMPVAAKDVLAHPTLGALARAIEAADGSANDARAPSLASFRRGGMRGAAS